MLARRVMAANMQQQRPLAAAMKQKLEAALKPRALIIIDESHKHAGHSGNPSGAPDAETHFKVEIVSEEFQGKRLVQRHQMVYQLLQDEFKQGLHALSMDTKTPDEASK